MKVETAFWAFIAIAAVAVDASHSLLSRHHHHDIARRANPLRKSCASHKAAPEKKKDSDNTTKPATPPPPTNNGIINVKSNCGNPGATRKTTKTSGPNGSLDWLTCGINSGGWKPPYIKISDLITVDLHDALKKPSSPFKQCARFIPLFEKYGRQINVPPIILASFAMQESSCRPETVGGGGEQGLMQITRDKCGGAPNGNCRDPDFNIRTGARYFAQTLKNNNGNVLATIGQYNGYFPGLTYSKATAARHSSCCLCQNNLDYLHQFLNGWILNIDAYSTSNRLGKYFNLDVCR